MIPTQLDNAFTNRSVLITGATGFVGRNLLSTLLKLESFSNDSLKITCATRDPKKLSDQWPQHKEKLNFLNWDIRTVLKNPQVTFDYIFHFAGENRTSENSQHAKEIYETSTLGTANVLDLAASQKTETKKIIFASSGAVYGNKQKKLEPFSEPKTVNDQIIDDSDPYRAGKASAELLCIKFAEKQTTKVMIARMFAFVGPYLPLHKNFAIGNFMQDCLLNRPIIVNSSGASIRSYQFTSDMINWLITILLNGESGQIYNVGSSEQISIANLAQRVSDIFGNKNKVKVLNETNADPVSDFYVPNISKAEKKLELFNNYSLENSLVATKDFLTKAKDA